MKAQTRPEINSSFIFQQQIFATESTVGNHDTHAHARKIPQKKRNLRLGRLWPCPICVTLHIHRGRQPVGIIHVGITLIGLFLAPSKAPRRLGRSRGRSTVTFNWQGREDLYFPPECTWSNDPPYFTTFYKLSGQFNIPVGECSILTRLWVLVQNQQNPGQVLGLCVRPGYIFCWNYVLRNS